MSHFNILFELDGMSVYGVFVLAFNYGLCELRCGAAA